MSIRHEFNQLGRLFDRVYALPGAPKVLYAGVVAGMAALVGLVSYQTRPQYPTLVPRAFTPTMWSLVDPHDISASVPARDECPVASKGFGAGSGNVTAPAEPRPVTPDCLLMAFHIRPKDPSLRHQ